MRTLLVTSALILAGALSGPAKADPYKWCAVYSGGSNGGGTNCYFVTIEQCQATVSGNGGFCRTNGFYDGRPVVTPEQRIRRG